mgnify:CR=1 FL=1
MPALLIAGEFDHVGPREASEQLAGLLPDAEYYEVPGAKHGEAIQPFRRDEAVFQKIEAFLQSLTT